jgi:adenylosuccinate synthase
MYREKIYFLQDVGAYLQKVGREFGVTTGRPRRCGWLDIPLLRYTNMVSGRGFEPWGQS